MTAPGSISNREGISAFEVRWAWADGDLEPGVTAVLRARNEARNLPWVLPPVLSVADRVVLVDNRSDDDTAAAAQACAERVGWKASGVVQWANSSASSHFSSKQTPRGRVSLRTSPDWRRTSQSNPLRYTKSGPVG